VREISVTDIVPAVAAACVSACRDLPEDVLLALERAVTAEDSEIGRAVLEELAENAQIARSEQVPLCQDTGFAVVFVEIGQDVHIVGGGLYDSIDEGVRRGYGEGYLRKSIVRHPLDRVNTGDNTPAVIHTTIVPGDSLKIIIAPKGGGSENMSATKMLVPADGADGVVRFVTDTVVNAGSNPCPPVIVGVGLGGTLEMAAILSKRAILRKIGEHSSNPLDADLERRLLQAVNATGVGPSGYGGTVTALAVHVESYPCHIASLPVAVTIQCHAARHAQAVF
jgi:fumarate hydratase subunit alpha